ncbi:MAG: aromatic ring-hydroxylating dioxygenase subunit alpha [Anaerolineales bacterium]|nr:aromatic ring-hydroxylating dioxygenase subunit alpha [Anaerolineales bacterium]
MTSKVYSTLPRQYYTSDQIFREETQRIFYERWVCVGRMEQIPNPGDYFVQQVGLESLIIVRTRNDGIRAHYNVCRHRGARLCGSKAQGHFREAMQCPYHAWTYSLDGKLIGAPHMNEVPDFKKEDYPLHSAQVHTWEGFIFVNLAAKPQPFDPLFAELSDKFAAWQISKLRSAHRIEYDVQANWKLLAENYSECYHCPLVHPALSKLSHYESGENDFVKGVFLGGYMELTHGSMTLDGAICVTPLSTVSGEDLNRVYYYLLFPNLLLSLHPDYVMFHTVWPQSPDRTLIVCEWLFDPAVMAQPDFDPAPAVEFWDMTNREDWHVCEITQEGVGSRVYTPGPAYVGQEDLIAAFDHEVLKALEHPVLN